MENNYIQLLNGRELVHIAKDTGSNPDLDIFHSVLKKILSLTSSYKEFIF